MFKIATMVCFYRAKDTADLEEEGLGKMFQAHVYIYTYDIWLDFLKVFDVVGKFTFLFTKQVFLMIQQ